MGHIHRPPPSDMDRSGVSKHPILGVPTLDLSKLERGYGGFRGDIGKYTLIEINWGYGHPDIPPTTGHPRVQIRGPRVPDPGSRPWPQILRGQVPARSGGWRSRMGSQNGVFDHFRRGPYPNRKGNMEDFEGIWPKPRYSRSIGTSHILMYHPSREVHQHR